VAVEIHFVPLQRLGLTLTHTHTRHTRTRALPRSSYKGARNPSGGPPTYPKLLIQGFWFTTREEVIAAVAAGTIRLPAGMEWP
jgi:hypothetical protein